MIFTMAQYIQEAKYCIRESKWTVMKDLVNPNKLVINSESALLPYVITYLAENKILKIDHYIGDPVDIPTISKISTHIDITLKTLLNNNDLNHIFDKLSHQLIQNIYYS